MNKITSGQDMCYIRFFGQKIFLEKFYEFIKKVMSNDSETDMKITYFDVKTNLSFQQSMNRDYKGTIDWISEVIHEDEIHFLTMQTFAKKSENGFWAEVLKAYPTIVCDIINFTSEGLLQKNQEFDLI